MALKKMPGELDLGVGTTTGPSSYTAGGFDVAVEVGEILDIDDVISLSIKGSPSGVTPVVSAVSASKVTVLPLTASGTGEQFGELDAGQDISDMTFKALAWGK